MAELSPAASATATSFPSSSRNLVGTSNRNQGRLQPLSSPRRSLKSLKSLKSLQAPTGGTTAPLCRRCMRHIQCDGTAEF